MQANDVMPLKGSREATRMANPQPQMPDGQDDEEDENDPMSSVDVQV
jgi:hypothetical protein